MTIKEEEDERDDDDDVVVVVVVVDIRILFSGRCRQGEWKVNNEQERL
jgi:hypothetical protein